MAIHQRHDPSITAVNQTSCATLHALTVHRSHRPELLSALGSYRMVIMADLKFAVSPKKNSTYFEVQMCIACHIACVKGKGKVAPVLN
jgi:hypothetical protein